MQSLKPLIVSVVFFPPACKRISIGTHSFEGRRAIGAEKYTVCRRVRASFSPEILQAGTVKGLITERSPEKKRRRTKRSKEKKRKKRKREKEEKEEEKKSCWVFASRHPHRVTSGTKKTEKRQKEEGRGYGDKG